jgi:hypothetical protein
MSSRSLTSSPIRTMGWPQAGVGQVVLSGSWWCSTRRRCSGSAWRRGWRLAGSCAGADAVGIAPCKASSWASRLASSSAIASSNIWRCSAFIASVLAPKRQAFKRASSKVIFSSLASLNLMACAWLAMCWSRSLSCLALRSDEAALLNQASQHLLGYLRHHLGAQTAKVLGIEGVHIEHVRSVRWPWR